MVLSHTSECNFQYPAVAAMAVPAMNALMRSSSSVRFLVAFGTAATLGASVAAVGGADAVVPCVAGALVSFEKLRRAHAEFWLCQRVARKAAPIAPTLRA